MSPQRIRAWAIALVLVILLSSIAVCGAGNPLLGKWEDEEGVIRDSTPTKPPVGSPSAGPWVHSPTGG